MAKNYTECKKNGGKLVTKKLKNDRFINICYDKNGKPHSVFFRKRKNSVDNNSIIVKAKKKLDKLNKPNVIKPTVSSLDGLIDHFSKSRLN